LVSGKVKTRRRVLKAVRATESQKNERQPWWALMFPAMIGPKNAPEK
jgi:hypothetical protein